MANAPRLEPRDNLEHAFLRNERALQYANRTAEKGRGARFTSRNYHNYAPEQRNHFSIIGVGGEIPDDEIEEIARRNRQSRESDKKDRINFHLPREAARQTAVLLNPGVVGFVREEPVYSPNCWVQLRYLDDRCRTLREFYLVEYEGSILDGIHI